MTRERATPTLINAPEVLSIPVEECGEPLVDLPNYPVLTTTDHPRATSPAESRLHCRASVADRLLAADRALPDDMKLLVLECHRPPELQERYWKEDLQALRDKQPGWSDEDLVRENAKFVAPPWEIPPHCTGAAVDLVLVDSCGSELDMGSLLNEEGSLMRTYASDVPEKARKRREELVRAMEKAGFVNYGHEWWHYSYGDRYWALLRGESAAIYGPAYFDGTVSL